MDDMKADPDLPEANTIDEMNGLVYSALMALTSDEPFDIVLCAGAGSGLEAWRRLHWRYDPGIVGIARIIARDLEPWKKQH